MNPCFRCTREMTTACCVSEQFANVSDSDVVVICAGFICRQQTQVRGNARPRVAETWTLFLEAETSQLSTASVFHFLPVSTKLAQPVRTSGPTSQRPQRSTLQRRCVTLHEAMLFTPICGLSSCEVHSSCLTNAGPKHTCAPIMVFDQQLYIPHLSGVGVTQPRRSAHSFYVDFNKLVPKNWEKKPFVCTEKICCIDFFVECKFHLIIWWKHKLIWECSFAESVCSSGLMASL